ncbi:MAG: CopG family transcriptional regulator [Candidatus Kapaibacterium sp.]
MQQAEQYVAEGWFDSVQSLIITALQRYLDTHQSDLNTEFIREDVNWGLRGGK